MDAMQNSYERRKHKRLPLNLTLEICKLYKQDHVNVNGINVNLEVLNISKSGIGFITHKDLPLDYYFDSKIELNHEDFFYTVIKIIRKEVHENETFVYGAQFIGLAPFLADKIEKYGETLESKDK